MGKDISLIDVYVKGTTVLFWVLYLGSYINNLSCGNAILIRSVITFDIILENITFSQPSGVKITCYGLISLLPCSCFFNNIA